MLSSVAGVPHYDAGQVVDLDDSVARAWMAAGIVEPVSAATETGASTRTVQTAVGRGRRRAQ